MIYPEGGRSPDGWGQDFKGGAAYLSARTGAPVVPVFIDGTGAIFGKGMKRPKPGETQVVFGAAAARRSRARARAGSTPASRPRSTTLGDEAPTDYWTARRRAASRHQPEARPARSYTGWRRQWDAHRAAPAQGIAGLRRRQKRRWPDLG